MGFWWRFGPVQSRICLWVPAIDQVKATVLGAGGSPSASFVENEIFSSCKDAKHSGDTVGTQWHQEKEMPLFDG